ncbi:solute carrier family 22 member 8-like [Octopus vulgaris]|uniref:Solute carrier family 22 member 8-like n=1 Tax=Octopus vulgaris TaxID=6645 RepID=A0AA36BAD7_OCTVU|nr:solute carrier family 22 member 8-like [Octopus vulgaris]
MRVSSHILLLVFNLIAAFSPSYWLFTIMRFLIGGAREAYSISTAVLLSELYPKERRIIMSCLFMNIWGLYNCVLGYIAYILKDYSWNVSFLFNAALSGYFILDFFFLKESLRWLFANSKVEAAEKIVKKAAKQNKVDFDKVWRITFTDSSQPEVDGHVKETSRECRNNEPKAEIDGKIVADQSQIQTGKQTSDFVKLLAIFKSPYLRKVTIVISIEISVGTGFATTSMRIACLAAPFLKLLKLRSSRQFPQNPSQLDCKPSSQEIFKRNIQK